MHKFYPIFKVLLGIGVFFLPGAVFGEITGNSGCLLRSGNQIVLVKDIWSKKFGLPGGTAEKNETATLTAERETLEETGIRVIAKKHLTTTANSFHIFDCEPKELQPVVLNADKIPVPTDAFNEIGEILLVDPDQIPLANWRFPEQRQVLLGLIPLAHDNGQWNRVAQNPIGGTSSFTARTMAPWIESELKWIQSFQTFRSDFLDYFFSVFTFLGGEGFALLFLPFLWFAVNKRSGIELTFLFALSVLVDGILKQAFAVPRPFYFLSELQRAEADGFGFPSGHTVSITLVWTWIALAFRFPGSWIVAFILSFLGGVARVYWGVHFIHDVVGGWLCACTLLCVYQYGLSRNQLKQVPLKIWYLLSAGVGLLALIVRPNPETVSVVAFLWGLLLVFISFSSAGVSVQGNEGRNIKELPIVLLGISLISFGARYLGNSGIFWVCLLVRIFKYFLMGIWVGSISFYFSKRKKMALVSK